MDTKTKHIYICIPFEEGDVISVLVIKNVIKTYGELEEKLRHYEIDIGERLASRVYRFNLEIHGSRRI
jgi:hypothetical protein